MATKQITSVSTPNLTEETLFCIQSILHHRLHISGSGDTDCDRQHHTCPTVDPICFHLYKYHLSHYYTTAEYSGNHVIRSNVSRGSTLTLSAAQSPAKSPIKGI